MSVNWEKLEADGRLNDPQISKIIEEVRKEMADMRIAKCVNQAQEGQLTMADILRQEQEEEEKLAEDAHLQPVMQVDEPVKEKKVEEVKIPDNQICRNCKKTGVKVNSCAACLRVWYCSVDCQKQNWKDHKKQCQIFQEEIKEAKRLAEKKSRKCIDWFKQLSQAGQGNFSMIYKMEEIKTGDIYAIKVIEKRRLKQLGKEKDILMEKHALAKLSGSNHAIEMYDTFQDELTLYLQMEFVDGGELWNYCRIFGLIADSLVKYFFASTLVALEFIHSKGIIHRDIKPENILVTTKGKKIKFCDFGTSRDANDDSVQGAGTGRPGKRMYEHFVGTPNFMAPECVRNKASEKSSDIFSLGGTVFQMKTGFPAYLGKSEFLIFLQSEKEDPIFKQELWAGSDDLKDLILRMMKRNMTERISIEEIKAHPYFKGVDWKNIPSYEEAMSEFTEEEKFFQRVKVDLLEKFEALNEKADQVDAAFNTWKDNLQNQNQFTQEQKEKMEKKLKFMRLQANQLFNIEEFYWQDFTYDPPKANEAESSSKKDQDDDEEEDGEEIYDTHKGVATE